MGRGAVGGVVVLLLALLLPRPVEAQTVRVGGSSTLYPATAAIAAALEPASGAPVIEVGFEGTGAGFDLFCRGAAELIGASRLATDEERQACSRNGVEYIVFPVAIDAVMLVVSGENEWLRCLSLEEVRRLWRVAPDPIDTWAELRPGLPDREIEFHAPGVASGTYDYWNRVVLGPEASLRTDYFPNEDDRRLAQLTADDRDAISFFGRAQLQLAGNGVRAVALDDGFGCLDPESQAHLPTRWPFLRPLFLYVSAAAVQEDDGRAAVVDRFVDTFLSPAGQDRLVEMGYLRLDEGVRRQAIERFTARVRGPLSDDFDGQAILRLLPGGWSRRQVELEQRLLVLQREVDAVDVVHRGFDPLVQSLLDGARGGRDDALD